MCTQKLNMNIEFLNKHFSSSSSQKTRKTVLKSFKIDFKSIFPMKPSQFGNVCTKFELDPSNENRAIKKIRWVGQIRPGPLMTQKIPHALAHWLLAEANLNCNPQQLINEQEKKVKSSYLHCHRLQIWRSYFI